MAESGTKWVLQQTDADIALMSKVLNINPIIAQVMAIRGLRTKNTALAFLNISDANIRPFSHMKDGQKAVDRIIKAITDKEPITIYGDYDADGITSTAILFKVLAGAGAVVSYYIPHRVAEGYGLNTPAIDKLQADGTQLMIALDNGIAAIQEVDHANALGVDVVIIDHHEPGDTIPNAVAVVDPKQADCPYPFKELCTGGLTYKLAQALLDQLGLPFVQQEEMQVLAAIATICDIVPLVDENRIITHLGLQALNANKLINPGLGSLLAIKGFLEKPIDTQTIGFVIGPFINAAGRLESAEITVELLLTASGEVEKRMALTENILAINDKRKEITTTCVDRILATLPAPPLDDVIVVVDTDIHESIAGIVAGRIKETTGHPTIVLTHGDGGVKGSGRSIPGYNMFEALSAHSHLLTRFGGHVMAAGLTLPAEHVPLLKAGLNQHSTLTPQDFLPITYIDATLQLTDVTMALSQAIQQLAPFGSGNKEPLFISSQVLVENIRAMDEKNTLIFTFVSKTGHRVKGIAFGLNGQFHQAMAGNPPRNFYMDLVYSIETNTYNGFTNVQLRVKDFCVLPGHDRG